MCHVLLYLYTHNGKNGFVYWLARPAYVGKALKHKNCFKISYLDSFSFSQSRYGRSNSLYGLNAEKEENVIKVKSLFADKNYIKYRNFFKARTG